MSTRKNLSEKALAIEVIEDLVLNDDGSDYSVSLAEGDDREKGEAAPGGLQSILRNGKGNNGDETDTDIALKKHSKNVERAAKRTKYTAMLVFVVGCGATAYFLWSGVRNENEIQKSHFERRSTDLALGLQISMRDYERSCSWIHESTKNWRNEDSIQDARNKFRELYNSVSYGLDFFAMQLIPNVTNEERAMLETEMAYYQANVSYVERNSADYQNLDYKGLYGVTPDNGFDGFVPQVEQPFYFPIQFDEPLVPHNVLHYNVYSAPWEQSAIDLAISTYKPAATGAFKLKGEESHESFSTVIYHPGIPPAEQEGGVEPPRPKDLATMLVHIQSLLTRALRYQTESMAIYLFDKSADMMYIGGMSIEVHGEDDEDFEDDEANAEAMNQANSNEDFDNVSAKGEEIRVLKFYADNVDLKDVVDGSSRLYRRDIEFASRIWTALVVPIDDTYDPDYTPVIVSAALIFAATMLLFGGMIYNMQRSLKMNRIMTKAAEADASIVANLFPKVSEFSVPRGCRGDTLFAHRYHCLYHTLNVLTKTGCTRSSHSRIEP